MSSEFRTLTQIQADSKRWSFIYPRVPEGTFILPRFCLHGPDACELRWSVWDRHTKTTYSRGVTADEAVDAAMLRYTNEQPAPL